MRARAWVVVAAVFGVVGALACVPDDAGEDESALPMEGSGDDGSGEGSAAPPPADSAAADIETDVVEPGTGLQIEVVEGSGAPTGPRTSVHGSRRPEGASYADVPDDWPCRIEQGRSTIWYVYDPVMTGCRVPPGTLGCPTQSFTTNTRGVAVSTYRYDEHGFLVELFQVEEGQTEAGLVQTYTYDEQGRVATTVDSSPLLGYEARTQWTWEGNTATATTTMPDASGEASMRYEMDADGRLVSMELLRPGGLPERTEIVHDDQGRVLRGVRGPRTVGRFVYCDE